MTGYSEVIPIRESEVAGAEDPGKLVIGGTPTGEVHQEGFEYTVKYSRGEPIGTNQNVCIDAVRNTRPELS